MDDLQALEAALLSGMDGQNGSLEPLCSIDPTTRRITVPDNMFGVESDEQAKRVYFSVPTVVGDNFDLSKARIQINFRNPNGDLGVYLVKDFTADAEGNATFSWSLRRIVTQYKGTVSFIVCATIPAGNNRIDREWNTTLAQGQVLEGLEVTQEMESLAHDIIGQLILAADEADSAASAAVNQVSAVAQAQKDAALTVIRTESTSQQNAIAKKAHEALQDIPESYVELSNQVDQMSEDLQGMAPAIIPTATGSIVTITDGAARPAVEVISHIEPLQSGSGEASPSNVRPISGWDSVTAQRTGKNLLQNYDVTVTSSQAYAQTYRDYILPAGVYTLRAWVTQGGTVTTTSISVRSLNNISQILGETDLRSQQGEIVVTFSAPNDGQGVRVYYYSNKTGTAMDTACTFANIVVESGRKYTGYEPYSGQTLFAALPETVYGGTLNWTTGVLKVTHHRIVFDGVTTGAMMDWTDPGSWTYAYIYPGSMPKTLKWNTTAYANKLKSVNTNTVIAFGLPADLTGATSADDPGTVAAKYNAVLKQWYDAGTPLEIVYEIATPEEIQLSPQQLDTLHGINNVWSDCGDTTISYVADTQRYIDNKLAAIAAATL